MLTVSSLIGCEATLSGAVVADDAGRPDQGAAIDGPSTGADVSAAPVDGHAIPPADGGIAMDIVSGDGVGLDDGGLDDVGLDGADDGAGASYVYPPAQPFAKLADPLVSAPQPAHLKPLPEPQFSTTLTRIVTNAWLGVSDGVAVNNYSKRQAWNIDETLIDVGHHLLDAKTYAVIRYLPISSERVWSSLDPQTIFGLVYNGSDVNELVRYDAAANSSVLLRKFGAYSACRIGHGEGNLSNDDRYLVLACDNKLISYDIVADKILGQLDQAPNYNWAGVSQSGAYVLVENNKYPDPKPELWLYDRDLSNPRLLVAGPAHGDLGLDENGDDVYVMINWHYLYYHRLKDNIRVVLAGDDSNPAGHGHVSCRNIKRPGYCYFSSNHANLVGALKIAAPKPGASASPDAYGVSAYWVPVDVEPFAHHRSTSAGYPQQPKASASPSGTKVVFASDWYGKGETNAYVAEFPQ